MIRRPLPLLACAGVVAVLTALSGCSAGSSAATVDGVDIPMDTFEADLAWDPADGLRLDSDGTLSDLALLRRGQAAPWIIVPALALVSRDLVYDDGAARVGLVDITGDATLVEHRVAPPQQVPLRNTRVTLAGATVPGPAPGRLTVEADVPDGGRLEARGDLDVWPFSAGSR